MLLNEYEAAEYVGRSRVTLRDWRLAGLVQAKKAGDLWWFEKTSLEHALSIMQRNYTYRRIVPGLGRGRFKPVGMEPLWPEKED